MFIRGLGGGIYNLDNIKGIYKLDRPNGTYSICIEFTRNEFNSCSDNLIDSRANSRVIICAQKAKEECDKILDGIYKEMESGSNFIDVKKIYDSITSPSNSN